MILAASGRGLRPGHQAQQERETEHHNFLHHRLPPHLQHLDHLLNRLPSDSFDLSLIIYLVHGGYTSYVREMRNNSLPRRMEHHDSPNKITKAKWVVIQLVAVKLVVKAGIGHRGVLYADGDSLNRHGIRPAGGRQRRRLSGCEHIHHE